MNISAGISRTTLTNYCVCVTNAFELTDMQFVVDISKKEIGRVQSGE